MTNSEANDYIGESSLSDDLAREAPAPFWTVAIYLCDRAYGGAEEGGWWYDYGERIDAALEGVNPNSLLTVFTDEDEARSYAETLQLQLDATVNKGRREISSVLSEGRYYAEAHPGHPPHHYPEEVPHYE
jgi:hypothetical protein